MTRLFLYTFAALAAIFANSTKAAAQQFDEWFCDSTLRIDYTFAGNATRQEIYVDKLNLMPRWYGKRSRMAELPVDGNGQITVRSHKTGQVIYRNSFSTLFQEWLSYDEAKGAGKSFENVFLIPMPKDTVDVTVDLRNSRREIMTTYTHTVVPSDILIRHRLCGRHAIHHTGASRRHHTLHTHSLPRRGLPRKRDGHFSRRRSHSDRRAVCTRAV